MPAIFAPDALHTLAVQVAQMSHPEQAPMSAPPSRGIGASPYLAMFGGQLADLFSTGHALNAGAVEGNPLFGKHPSMKTLALVKGAGIAGLAGLMRWLSSHRNGSGQQDGVNAAKGIGYGVGGLGTAVAAWNMTKGHR